MTIVDQPYAAASDSVFLAQALFEEARSRQRRRRRRGVVVGLAIASLVAGLTVTTSRGGRGGAPSSVGAVSQITAEMEGAGSADLSIVLSNTFLATPIVRGCPMTAIRGSGIIDFAPSSIELHLTGSPDGCGSTFAMQERQIGNVLYQTDPSGGRGILTSPGKPWLKTPWATPAALPVYGYGGVFGSTTAGFVVTALRSLQGPVTRIGTRIVDGVTTTGYTATITLDELQSASRVQARSSGATFEDLTAPSGSLPAAVDIPISMAIWVDATNRIRRLQATEPVYALNYGDGSGVIGPQIYPSEYLGRPLAADPYTAGYVVLTLTLTDYHTPQAVLPPPRDQVTNGIR